MSSGNTAPQRLVFSSAQSLPFQQWVKAALDCIHLSFTPAECLNVQQSGLNYFLFSLPKITNEVGFLLEYIREEYGNCVLFHSVAHRFRALSCITHNEVCKRTCAHTRMHCALISLNQNCVSVQHISLFTNFSICSKQQLMIKMLNIKKKSKRG